MPSAAAILVCVSSVLLFVLGGIMACTGWMKASVGCTVYDVRGQDVVKFFDVCRQGMVTVVPGMRPCSSSRMASMFIGLISPFSMRISRRVLLFMRDSISTESDLVLGCLVGSDPTGNVAIVHARMLPSDSLISSVSVSSPTSNRPATLVLLLAPTASTISCSPFRSRFSVLVSLGCIHVMCSWMNATSSPHCAPSASWVLCGEYHLELSRTFAMCSFTVPSRCRCLDIILSTSGLK